MVKTFGTKNRTRPAPERVPFDFIFLRDEEPETHHFNALAVTDFGGLAQVFGSSVKHPERALGGMMSLIAKMLDNKDGVPANWTPEVHNAKERLENDDLPAQFRAPFGPHKGELLDMARAEEFTAHAVGSSRRRWLELMDPENLDLSVDEKDLTGLFEWLVGLAANRPTGPSSSSGE